MVKVTVCIGSSCHLKGSRQVVEELQYLINKNNLGGVSVTVDDEYFAVKPENVMDFFTDVIVKKIQ